MRLAELADDVFRSVESAGARARGRLLEPVIRLGVTGLSQSGKTVFITSLVANLLNRGRMPQFLAAASGSVRSAYLQPQPDDTVPRFEYETHMAALCAKAPVWPQSTREISQLRVTMRVRPAGLLAGIRRVRTVHLDIVDYPGEWLLDLPLMDQSYREWSAASLASARSDARAPLAQTWLGALKSCRADARFDETCAQELAAEFTKYLHAARGAGFSGCAPGRFLLPGALEGSPALTFAPLDQPTHAGRGTLWREMERRYNAYKSQIVKPFFRDHFAHIDRQIVLVDALGAIHAGPRAVADLGCSVEDILRAFRPGRKAWLSRVFGRRLDRVLFAATKADHLHHKQHSALTAFMEALVEKARGRAEFAGAGTAALSIAAVRATVEETRDFKGRTLDCVRGRLLKNGRTAAFYPGALPSDPSLLLDPARKGAERWLEEDYQVMNFSPARPEPRPGFGPPHIRLDKAVEFLIGDRL